MILCNILCATTLYLSMFVCPSEFLNCALVNIVILVNFAFDTVSIRLKDGQIQLSNILLKYLECIKCTKNMIFKIMIIRKICFSAISKAYIYILCATTLYLSMFVCPSDFLNFALMNIVILVNFAYDAVNIHLKDTQIQLSNTLLKYLECINSTNEQYYININN